MSFSASSTVNPANLTGTHREKVSNIIAELFELQTPTLSALQKVTEEDGDMNAFGVKMPLVTNEPGGHGAFTIADSSFNAPIALDTAAMFSAPVGYAIALHMNGRTINAAMKGSPDARLTYQQIIEYTSKSAGKRLNRMAHGDRNGALAYSASTLGSTGSGQTLNCEYTASTTVGHTKGARFLKKNHIYQAINASTDAVRGTFTVEAEGTTSCTVNVTAGTITSGDPIVDVGSWKRWFSGFGNLIGNHSRELQTRDTSVDIEMNDPTVDLNGNDLTPATVTDLKASVQTRQNDKEGGKGLYGVMTFGQHSKLAKQGYGFQQYINGNNGVFKGTPYIYEDGDTTWILDADAEDDRLVLFDPSGLKRLVEKNLGLFDEDQQEWRMWFGSNDAGSYLFMRAIGAILNIAKVKLRCAALAKRASLTGVVRQTGSF